MSTSCGIALRTGDTYQTIYCHWDGYPERMLPMLSEHYNSRELANTLISYGDASSVYEKLDPTPGIVHTFEDPEDGVCVFYHRDRGEDWLSCRSVCYTKSELFKQAGFSYIYIFEDGQWNAYHWSGKKV
jgi:hypothetical protein